MTKMRIQLQRSFFIWENSAQSQSIISKSLSESIFVSFFAFLNLGIGQKQFWYHKYKKCSLQLSKKSRILIMPQPGDICTLVETKAEVNTRQRNLKSSLQGGNFTKKEEWHLKFWNHVKKTKKVRTGFFFFFSTVLKPEGTVHHAPETYLGQANGINWYSPARTLRQNQRTQPVVKSVNQ